MRPVRPGRFRSRQAAGRPSAAGRPVAVADAGAGRRRPSRRGARGLRAGADRHCRPARRRSGRRAAPAVRRPPGQGPSRAPGHHLGRPGDGACRGTSTRSSRPRPRGPAAETADSAQSAAPGRGPRPGREARSGAPVPAQLPADIADFTGRDEQVNRLCDLLSASRASGDPGAVRIAVVAGAGRSRQDVPGGPRRAPPAPQVPPWPALRRPARCDGELASGWGCARPVPA